MTETGRAVEARGSQEKEITNLSNDTTGAKDR